MVTYKDIPDNIYITNQISPHYRPLNETPVRFVGTNLVVADTEDIALDAMELIEVEYEELPRYSPLTKRWLGRTQLYWRVSGQYSAPYLSGTG